MRTYDTGGIWPRLAATMAGQFRLQKGGQAVEGPARHDLVAFSPKGIPGIVSQDMFGLGVPENDALIEINGVGSVWSILESGEQAHGDQRILSHPHNTIPVA